MEWAEKFFSKHWPSFLIIFAGIFARIWWLTEVNTQPITDFAWYFDRAAGLASGMGYTTENGHTAYWPPGYPLFLALIFKFTGPSLIAAKFLNATLTLLCALLTSAITFRLIGSRTLACLAGLLVALSPGMIAYSGILASEPLYTTFLLGSVYTVLWAQTYSRWGLAGFLLGLATLVRPQALLTPIALAFCPTPQSEFKQPQIRKAIALCILVALITTGPWLIRTARTHKSFVFVSTNGGDNLWIGHNANATGKYQTPPGKPASPSQELLNDQETKSIAVSQIKQNFGRSISLIPPKLTATFATPTDITYWAFQTVPAKLVDPGTSPQRELFLYARSATRIFTTSLLICSLLGILLGIASPSGRRIVSVALPHLVLTSLIVAIFFGNGRFAIPTIPFQIMLVIAGLATIREGVGRHTPPDPDHYGFTLEN